MKLFKHKEDKDLLRIVSLISSLMERQDKMEKTLKQTGNRVENLLERMKREEDHCLARRMDNIEKVQNSQGATLEGYLDRMGKLAKRQESCENAINDLWPKTETEATLFDSLAKKEKNEQDAAHSKTKRTYHRDKERPRAETWASRYDLPMSTFKIMMMRIGITKEGYKDWYSVRLTENQAWEAVRCTFYTAEKWHK